MPHTRVPKAANGRETTPQSTWGTWPLCRRCWIHPRRMSEAPHTDCSEDTAPVQCHSESSVSGWTASAHHSRWRSRQVGLPLHIYSGQTTNSGKSLLFQLVLPEFHLDTYFLIRHPWAWYGMPLLGDLNHKTNYNRYKKNRVLCPLSAKFSKVTSDFGRLPYDIHMSSRDLFKVTQLPEVRYSSFP